jgi:TrmH family RNA methyltransferase
VLDAVQDPGNVGTMLRTALGLGASGLVALAGTAELANPKVVRGSMGALFRLRAVHASPGDFLEWARGAGVRLWVASAQGVPLGRGALGARDRRPPVALVVGNEGAGTSPAIEAAAERRIAIPLAPGVESLNVAVAAGILLHEVLRD